MVSAQFCFHYMFGSEKGLKAGLSSILSNLLVGGIFMATIPDSYVIVKKINEQGESQSDGSRVIGNKYFSIRFEQTSFAQPYNNKYGFYLEESVGSKK
jgi:mRNA (guanine-N7-)-methyltransferase